MLLLEQRKSTWILYDSNPYGNYLLGGLWKARSTCIKFFRIFMQCFPSLCKFWRKLRCPTLFEKLVIPSNLNPNRPKSVIHGILKCNCGVEVFIAYWISWRRGSCSRSMCLSVFIARVSLSLQTMLVSKCL
jgi:hypothetical protein